MIQLIPFLDQQRAILTNMSENDSQTAAQASEELKIRRIKVIAYIAVAVVIGWFIVEVFLPSPFPHVAY